MLLKTWLEQRFPGYTCTTTNGLISADIKAITLWHFMLPAERKIKVNMYFHYNFLHFNIGPFYCCRSTDGLPFFLIFGGIWFCLLKLQYLCGESEKKLSFSVWAVSPTTFFQVPDGYFILLVFDISITKPAYNFRSKWWKNLIEQVYSLGNIKYRYLRLWVVQIQLVITLFQLSLLFSAQK